MKIDLSMLIIGTITTLLGILFGTIARGYFSSKDKREDQFQDFKEKSIADIAVIKSNIEAISNTVFEIKGRVSQNTEIIQKHVGIMDHVSRQLNRLFELNGQRAIDKNK